MLDLPLCSRRIRPAPAERPFAFAGGEATAYRGQGEKASDETWFDMTAGTVYSGPHWQPYATTDTGLAHDFFRRMFLDFQVRFSGVVANGTGLRTSSSQLGAVGFTRLDYAAPTRLKTLPAGDLTISHVLHGRDSLVRGKDEYRAGPGDSVLILPDDSVDVRMQDLGLFVVRLPRALVEDVARAETGISGADLRFDWARPVSAALARHWSETISYLARGVLAEPALVVNGLIVEQTCRLLAATALAVFPNTSLDARRGLPGAVAPRALRRAMAYIEENAERPVTITEIATAASVSARALQSAFRRHHETTPLQYARRVRLERAHRDLRAGDPAGTTVTLVATRWGFTHLGRFSSDYRTVYGVSPSRTLRS
jgi:AraC-like DNA-binding protein